MVWVGEHKPDSLTYLVGRGRQLNCIALRLAHFGFAVDAGKASDARNKRAGFWQHFNTSLAIDAANNLIGLLYQWSLIFSNRNNRRFETGDVGDLGDGIAEEACRNISAKASRLDFVLDGRVALKPRHRDEVQVQQGQVGKRREMRLQTDCGHVGVDSDSQIVCRDL